jgi:hypothetical protein
VPTNRSKRTLRQDSGTKAPTGTANTVPSNKNKVLPLSAPGHRIAAVIRESRIKPTLLSSPRIPAFYRTLRQKQSRISRHRIPYSPARTYRTVRQMLARSRSSLISRRKAFLQKTCKSWVFLRCLVPVRIYRTLLQALPYSPTKDTVLSDKPYRTLRQALPYSPTSLTVLSDKPYRTAPQNIAYPATRAVRDVPAKWGKVAGDRSERPVCVYC